MAQIARTYTVKELADVLDFSTNTVYKYLDEGKIQSTRLAGQGRFRIPEKEVMRLLGLKGRKPQLAAQIEQAVETPATVPISGMQEVAAEHQEPPAILSQIYAPTLFDLFVASVAILTSVAYFLFPTYLEDINIRQYLPWLVFAKISLITLGVVLIFTDVLNKEKRTWHIVLNFSIAGLLLLQGFIFWRTGNLLPAVGTLGLGCVIIATTFSKMNDYLRFVLLVLVLGGLFGLVAIAAPEHFPAPLVSQWIETHGLAAALVYNSILAVAILSGIYGVFRGGPAMYLLPILLVPASLGYAILAFGQGEWEQVMYNVVVTSFALVFPLWRTFDSFARFYKEKITLSFIWFTVVLLVGVTVIIYLQRSFKNFVVTQNQKVLQQATRTIESDLGQSSQLLTNFGKNPDVIQLMKSAAKDTGKLEALVKGFYTTPSILHQVAILDSNGSGLTAYPPNSRSKPSGDEVAALFESVKANKVAAISDAFAHPTLANRVSMVMLAPIINDSSDFLGAVWGEIDLNKLSEKLYLGEIKGSKNYVIADKSGQIFVHRDSSQYLKRAQPKTTLALAVAGKTGQKQNYDEQGRLSLQVYRPLKSLQWGMVVQQPLSEVSKQSSKTAFSIFMASVIVGIGSFFAMFAFRR